MMYKVGDEVLVKAEVTDLHEGLERPYFLYSHHLGWVSESEVVPMDKTYADGLSDAWELAKKIANISSDAYVAIFGMKGLYSIVCCFSYEEALAKIEAYEKEKEIKVGDVVELPSGYEIVVTTKNDSMVWGVDKKGDTFSGISKENVTKTGKHIDIESLLRQIGE